jgi:hypothetical protein
MATAAACNLQVTVRARIVKDSTRAGFSVSSAAAKERQMGLGSLNTITLKEAREEAVKCRAVYRHCPRTYDRARRRLGCRLTAHRHRAMGQVPDSSARGRWDANCGTNPRWRDIREYEREKENRGAN